MTNELKTQGLPASITESINIGKVFFESGLFADLKSAAQAVVKIQAGAEIGIPPFAALSGIHIILGKPVLGAGIIASKIKSSGKYDYKVIAHTETVCSIDFYQGKEKLGTSAFTIEDAKKANTKNIDKFPMNMLFARSISNGVKWFCPDVFNGPVYTPEEMEDVPHEEIKLPELKTNGNGQTKIEDIRPEIKFEDDKWQQAVFALKNGYSIEKIEAKYYLTKENRELLLTASI